MRRNANQILLKYEIIEQKSFGENSLIFKERMKGMLRFFLFITLAMFLLFVCSPVYFQWAFFRRSGDISIYGWGLNTSRFMPLYVLPDNDTSLILNKNLCSDPLLLLVVVCSAVKHSLERLVIRETWGNFSSSYFKLAFLLGTTKNATLQEDIEEESQLYNDIIQEDFVDSYNNLTLKSVMLLKFIKNHCPRVDFILKSDDDVFVYIRNLFYLLHFFKKIKARNVLVGELIWEARPIHDTMNKWYAPRYMFKEPVYPHYVSGTSYLMDRSAAVALYEAALKTPFFHLEDVYITGLCAKKAHITPKRNLGFSYQSRPVDPCLYLLNQRIITSHRVAPKDMRLLWAGINNGTYCYNKTYIHKPPCKRRSKRKNSNCIKGSTTLR